MLALNEKCIWGGQSSHSLDFYFFGPIVIHFAGDNLSGPGGTRDGGVK